MRKLIFLFIVLFSSSLFGQLQQFKAYKLRAIDSLIVNTKNVTSFFPRLDDYNRTQNDNYADESVSWSKLDDYLKSLISGGGGISISGNYLNLPDTSYLKSATSDSALAVAFLLQLSPTNERGGGHFVQLDSAFMEGVIAYDNGTPGKQWVRTEFLEKRMINALWAGVYNDSTNGDINGLRLTMALYNGSVYQVPVYIPSGDYVLTTAWVPNLYPNNVIIGNPASTNFRLGTESGAALFNPYDVDFVGEDSLKTNIVIDGIRVNGPYTNNHEQGGGKGGIQVTFHSGSRLNRVNSCTIKNCYVKGVISEGIKITGVKYAYIMNNEVYDCAQTGITVAADHAIITDNVIDRCRQGMEIPVYDYFEDTNFPDQVLIKGNLISVERDSLNELQLPSTESYGIRCYGGGDVKIIDNFVYGDKDSLEDMGYAIQIVSNAQIEDAYKKINKTRNFEISGNVLGEFYSGISTYNVTINDTIDHIRISDNIIYNMWVSSITLRGSPTDKPGYISDVQIINNTIYDWGKAPAGLQIAIVLDTLTNATVTGNRIYQQNNSTASRVPIRLNNCVNPLVMNNDFSQGISSYVYLDTLTTGYIIANNKGLNQIDGGINYFQYNPDIYDEQGWESKTGGLTIKGIDFFEENDQLKITDNSDTTTIFPETYSKSYIYFSNESYTLTLPKDTWTWMSSPDSNLWLSSYSTNIDEVKDIVYIEDNGYYSITGNLSFKPADDNLHTYLMCIGADTTDTTRFGSTLISAFCDSNKYLNLNFDLIKPFSVNDSFKFYMKDLDGPGDVVLRYANFVFDRLHKYNKYGPNLITNDGFELFAGTADDDLTDNFDYWNEAVTGAGIVEATSEDDEVYRGTYAVKITDTTASAVISCNISKSGALIAVTPTTDYQFSFYTRGDGTHDGTYRIYDIANTTNIVQAATGVSGTTYQNVSYDFTTADNATYVIVYFYVNGINGSVNYFDNAFLRVINE